MPILEHFTGLLDDRGSACDSVNDARKELFTQKERSMDAIPPTSNSLLYHAKRAAYQAGRVWSCMLPEPGQWGWQRNLKDQWEPSLPQASKSCQELLKYKFSRDMKRQLVNNERCLQ